jgi:hypothetical protein
MTDDPTLDYEPAVLRVLQSKHERRAYYDKIAGKPSTATAA